MKYISSSFVGLYNSGKSSLINTLYGEKILATHHKRHTTCREYSLTKFIEPYQCSIIMWDNQGFSLEHQDNRYSQSSLFKDNNYVDIYFHVVDGAVFYNLISYYSNKILLSHKWICSNIYISRKLDKLCSNKIKPVFIINKIDMFPKDIILKCMEFFNQYCRYYNAFFVSAKNSSGVADIEKFLIEKSSTKDRNFFHKDSINIEYKKVSEIIIEVCINNLHDEIPYKIVLSLPRIKKIDKKIFVQQNIFVKKKSHYHIITGQKGVLERKILSRLHSLDNRYVFSLKIKKMK